MSDEERRTADEKSGQPLEYNFRPSQAARAKERKISPTRMTQVAVELIFLLLGLLVVWLGATGHINFDRRSIAWLVISVGVAAWGLMALGRPGPSSQRWQKWNRGGSMLVLGLLMLAISRVPFLWVGKLLAVCGVVLLLRGALGSLLILKQR
jgi:hypothetical protein